MFRNENKTTFHDTGQDSSLAWKDGQDPAPTPKVKRMSITLTGDAIEHLDFLSKSQGITQNEALKKAIATEVYIRKNVMLGAKVFLQDPNGEIREVVFR